MKYENGDNLLRNKKNTLYVNFKEGTSIMGSGDKVSKLT